MATRSDTNPVPAVCLSPPQYLLCLTGCRIINKRMAMFIEEATAAGLGVRIAALPRGPWVLDKSENPTVPDRIGRISADIRLRPGSVLSGVLCFHWSVLPLAVLAGLIWRVPVIYDEHDHYELNTLEGDGSAFRRRLYSVLVRCIHRMCLPWVSLVTCIHLQHQVLKKHLQRWQPAVLEIHNYPAKIWREFPRNPHPDSRLCFVYIGGVYREKGVGAAADAFRALPPHLQKQAELHVFGDGDRMLIQQLQQFPGVTVHHGVSPTTFRQFTADHRCCGLSLLASTPRYSLVGTNCTKLYEYLALGMPVIATCVGEFPEFIRSSEVGLLIDGDLNTDQLNQAMQELLANPLLFQCFSVNAKTLMNHDDMTWEHQWKRVEQTGVLSAKRAA